MAGFRVVDLSEGLCGPFCTMHLGDSGAEVIKIEPPGGDRARRIGPQIGGESAVFLSLNRNKKSVVIDYRSAAGQEIVKRLAATADVVVEDFGPGAAAKLGLAYDELKERNPRLVYCAISPFGEEGPLAELPGAELTIQAMAEYTASLGSIGEPPVRVGADVASLNTAIFAVQGIVAALFHRERTGAGQRVAVSQFGTLLHMRGIMWHALSNPDDWFGFHLDSYTYPPEYGYQTKDGPMYFILRHGSSEDWDRFVIELGMEAYLDDPRFRNYGRAATGIGQERGGREAHLGERVQGSHAPGNHRPGAQRRRRRGAHPGLPGARFRSAGESARRDREIAHPTAGSSAPWRRWCASPKRRQPSKVRPRPSASIPTRCSKPPDTTIQS